MYVCKQKEYDFKDVLIKPRPTSISSRNDVQLETEIKFVQKSLNVIPIIVANMTGCGTITMARALYDYKCMVALHKHYAPEKLIEHFRDAKSEYSFYSMGITDADVEKFKYVNQNANLPLICIDVANGYMEKFVDFCDEFTDAYPDKIVIAGNVVTNEGTASLMRAGVDIVKVGIGSGATCTTRKITGVGRPQLSAIEECVDETNLYKKRYICSDGGCTVPGDFAKAFGAGATFVMGGGMFAAHDESELVKNDQDEYQFYGMSSKDAMINHATGVAQYKAAEGKTVSLKSRGSIKNTIEEILGGLRSTCSYTGSKNLEELKSNIEFFESSIQTNDIFGRS